MGRPVIDLSGQKFGRLTVIERDSSKPSGAGKSAYWLCKCDCGNNCSIRSDKLKKGITQSCGCLSKDVRTELFLKDLKGQRFGRLIAIERDTSKPMGKGQFAYWHCKCDCGNSCSVRGDHLRDGTTQSCGCLNSAGEEKITSLLINQNIKYQTQYTFPDLRGDYHNLRFDFAIFDGETLKCLIEYQGDQHYRPWGSESQERFQKRQEYDEKKRQFCLNNHIKLIEIPYKDFDKLDWEYLKTRLEE